MKKCIAAGTVASKVESGVVIEETVASVYEDDAATEESGSAGESEKYVVLKYKNLKYTEDLTAPLGYDDIAGDGELVVPGLNGHEDVTLAAPLSIRYSRTKSFERDGNVAVYATIRYAM